MPRVLTLEEFFRLVYIVRRPLKPRSVSSALQTIGLFDRWHGSPVRLIDLTDELLNAFLIDMSRAWRPRTVRRRRTEILMVWRLALETGHTRRPPGIIRKINVPRRLPEAWTLAELRRLLDAAAAKAFDRELPNGIHEGRFWRAFVLTAYDSALRASDLLALERSAINAVGQILVLQEKTQDGHLCRLRGETLEAIAAIFPPERERIFAWPWRREAFYSHWRQLLAASGMRQGPREGPQKLRRTSASYVERNSPGAATKHLGHKSGDLARRHYIDPRIADDERPLPPPIE